MNKDIAQKWVEALRSGKYKQVKGALRTPNGMCCLGVLCDLHDPSRWIDPDPKDPIQDGAYGYKRPEGSRLTNPEVGVLPMDIRDWAEMTDNAGLILIDGGRHSLSGLNDRGKSFEEIAQIIEEQVDYL